MSNVIASIPTLARGQVRAFIRGQIGFQAWIDARGIESRDVKNADLLAFAEEFNLMQEVGMIIAQAENDGNVASISQPCEVEQGAVANAFDLKGLLAGVDQFLSPLVKGELEKALAPVVVAANKPAVVKTVERVVTVEAQAVAPAGQIPYARKLEVSATFNSLFGTRTREGFGSAHISLWDAAGLAPAVDPFYVVDPVNMGMLATAAERGSNVWAVGPSGSGKTTLPEQFCAYTGRPFVKIGFTRQTEVGELIGNQGFREGATVWEDGVLIAAMRRPGTVILLDEITIAPAGVQAIIQGIVDEHRAYTIHATGEVVRCAQGVVFMVADNTNGSGDETGIYAGTNQSNGALVNRFSRMIRVDYLTKAQEATALRNHTNIPREAAQHVVEFFASARKLPEMEGVVLSLRQMTAFVNNVKDGFSSKMAFEASILNKLPGTERAVIEALATLDWNNQFERLLAGIPATAQGSQSAPSDSSASQAFDDEISASLNR